MTSDDVEIIIRKNPGAEQAGRWGWKAKVNLPIMKDLTDGSWIELILLGEKVSDKFTRKMSKDSEKAIYEIDNEVYAGTITIGEGNAKVNALLESNRKKLKEHFKKGEKLELKDWGIVD